MSAQPAPDPIDGDLDAQLDALAGAADPPEDDVRTARAALARAALVAALALGVLGDALLHEGITGIAFPLWIAVSLAVVVALAWRRADRLRTEQALWMGLALLFASALAWRDEEALQVFDVFGVVACLAMLGMTFAGTPVASVLAARVRDLVRVAARTVVDGVTGVVPLALVDADWQGLAARLPRHRALPLVRAAVITLPLLLVFGALLRSADPMFAALLALPALDVEVVVSHVVLTAFLAWAVGGWMRGALVSPRPPQEHADRRLLSLGALEVSTVLGALAGLFALFVLVQLRWLFGGEALVQRTTGLSYAQYARRGFFELMWVALLTVPVLLGLHAAVPETDSGTRRRYRVLGGVVLTLLGAMLVSAAGRMQLYIRFYGLSTDRFYASAIMVWAAVVLLWFAATVLRERPRTFAAGMALSALAVLAALNVLDPARLVASVNIARGPVAVSRLGNERSVDYAYLASLGADPVGVLVPALVRGTGATSTAASDRERCTAASRLVRRWADADARDMEEWDWRRWNASRARARAVVRANETALRRLAAAPVCRVARPNVTR